MEDESVIRGYNDVMNLAELLKAKRKEILGIAEKHGAHNVRVFGSVVRGDAGEQSDVDFLVELDRNCSLMDHAALLADLEKLLGCKVDVAPEDRLRPKFRDRILKEAIPL